MAATTILANGFMASAAVGPDCLNGRYGDTEFSGAEFQHREKTGEHAVTLKNGLQAVCYDYAEYYLEKRYCLNCGSFFYVNTVYTVHSLSGQ